MTEDHEAEMDAFAAQLEAAGLLLIRTLPDGTREYQLTERGVQVGGRLATATKPARTG